MQVGQTTIMRTIKYCYNYGIITGSTKGAILGSGHSNDTIENCYFLEGTAPSISNGEGVNIDDKSSSKDETFMKSQDFVNLLGAENWTIEQGKNGGYPILK